MGSSVSSVSASPRCPDCGGPLTVLPRRVVFDGSASATETSHADFAPAHSPEDRPGRIATGEFLPPITHDNGGPSTKATTTFRHLGGLIEVQTRTQSGFFTHTQFVNADVAASYHAKLKDDGGYAATSQ